MDGHPLDIAPAVQISRSPLQSAELNTAVKQRASLQLIASFRAFIGSGLGEARPELLKR